MTAGRGGRAGCISEAGVQWVGGIQARGQALESLGMAGTRCSSGSWPAVPAWRTRQHGQRLHGGGCRIEGALPLARLPQTQAARAIKLNHAAAGRGAAGHRAVVRERSVRRGGVGQHRHQAGRQTCRRHQAVAPSPEGQGLGASANKNSMKGKRTACPPGRTALAGGRGWPRRAARKMPGAGPPQTLQGKVRGIFGRAGIVRGEGESSGRGGSTRAQRGGAAAPRHPGREARRRQAAAPGLPAPQPASQGGGQGAGGAHRWRARWAGRRPSR